MIKITDIEIKGLDSLEEKLKAIDNKYPAETEKKLKSLGRKLKKMTKDNTPKKTGKLKKGYKLSPVKYSRAGSSYITLKNTKPHFHLVENGHKIVDKNGSEVGFVQGKKMLDNAVTELDEQMEEIVGDWIDNLLEG